MSDGEFDRIARLSARFRGPAAPAIGIGDDAAVLPVVEGPLVVTVDASVEDVHFRRAWAPLDRLAERAVHAALSDLAAMGADPSLRGGGVLFALELPSHLSAAAFDSVIEGLARGAEANSAPVLGGNLTKSANDTLSITTTAMGVAPRPLLRSGARAGDIVYVTGAVGASRVGLEALLRGREREALFAPFVERWIAARAHIAQGLAIAPFATAAIDLSDGLAQDAAHLARASRVALLLRADAIDPANSQRDAALALGEDPLALTLSSGEDYVLLFTAPPSITPPVGEAIGVVREGDGVMVERNGVERPARGGWDHFGD
jgi:thiamine-monophosphate kinase